jgi:hypothetical protein
MPSARMCWVRAPRSDGGGGFLMVAGDAAGHAGPDRDDAPTHGEVIRVGQLSLDVGRLAADTGQGPVPLTRLEFLLLRELAECAGQPVPKSKLLATVWGYEFDPGTNVVDVCVWRLRVKLGPDLITTVRGEGYRLAARLPGGVRCWRRYARRPSWPRGLRGAGRRAAGAVPRRRGPWRLPDPGASRAGRR